MALAGYVVELGKRSHSLSPSPLTSWVSQMLLGVFLLSFFSLEVLNVYFWWVERRNVALRQIPSS